MTVSWVPLVADYTRFSRDRRSAFFGVGIGYLLPTLFQFGFGSILVLSRGVDPSRPERLLTPIAGGGRAAAARAARAHRRRDRRGVRERLLDRGLDCRTSLPRVPQRALIVGVVGRSRPPARSRSTCASYQRFLLLLGAFFVPLLGVLRRGLAAGRARTTRAEHVFDGPRCAARARSSPGSSASSLYEWLYQPADLGFWSRWIGHLPTPSYQIGASLPSFAVAFLLTALAVTLGSPRAAARPRREPRARPALTAARRGSAAGRTTRHAPGAGSARERRSTRAADPKSVPTTSAS